MKLTGPAQTALDGVVNLFSSGQAPEVISHTILTGPSVPMNKWSFLNRLACYARGTNDARGFRQWKEVGRSVNKGAKAIYILAPTMATFKNGEKNENGQDMKETRLIGFHAIPVFKYEDSHGKEIERLKPPPPPPLFEVATAWGIAVTFEPSGAGYWGAYSSNRNAIRLCTPDEDVFYHELAHAAHDRLLQRQGKKIKAGQDMFQEVVAETSAAILARLFGCKTEGEGRSFQYCQRYAENARIDLPKAICKALHTIEQVIGEILGASNGAKALATVTEAA